MKPILTPQAEHLDLDGIKLQEHPNDGTKIFPDGEVYVQLEGIENLESALVIHSGAPQPNRGMMYLYGILHILKQENIQVEVLFTYFPYGMQDREFYPGTLNFARSILDKLVEYYGVEEIHIIDPHFKGEEWTDHYPLNILSVKSLVKERLENSKVIGPDKGAEEIFGVESLDKSRLNSKEVDIEGRIDIESSKVTVIDDIVETGGTLEEIYDIIRENDKINEINAHVVHGVLEEGVQKAAKRFDNLLLTNSIKNPESSIRIEPLIRKTLQD